ncbi:hypothetical protein [Chthonobacter albigriseus]|uniref:hypothetical protein n=1 Tax=Chthonobacter albigriseus TaxID=1683161 RepID=UPI0015EFD95A|nr:hypothetical protein [Chthonobacter albigriseus]
MTHASDAGGFPAEPEPPVPGDVPSPDTPEPTHKPPAKTDMPAAGPHSTPELTDEDRTPGAGTLPDPGEQGDMDSTSG